MVSTFEVLDRIYDALAGKSSILSWTAIFDFYSRVSDGQKEEEGRGGGANAIASFLAFTRLYKTRGEVVPK